MSKTKLIGSFLGFPHLNKSYSAVENKNLCIILDCSPLPNPSSTPVGANFKMYPFSIFRIFHCYYLVRPPLFLAWAVEVASLLLSCFCSWPSTIESPHTNQSNSSNAQMWSCHPLDQNPKKLPVAFRIKWKIPSRLTSPWMSCTVLSPWSYLLSHCPLFIRVQCHGLFRFINISNTLLFHSICTFHFLCLRSSLPSGLTGDSVPSSERSSFPDNCPSYHHYPCPHNTALIFSMALIIMYLEWGVHDNSFVHLIFPALSTVSGT